MADNVELDPGTGGAIIAADDVSSVFYQRVKLDGGGDGSGTPVLAGGGVEASALRVTVASDSTGVLSVDDNGGSLTVDVGTALPAGTNNIGDVDVLSSALPTGASTSAKQDTVIGHLDGVETVLGTIDADTSILAGAVSGTEMQVDVLTMPSTAVTNAGTFAVQADTELTTADMDTGGGTDTRAVVGTVWAASGGAVLTSAASPLPVQPGSSFPTQENGSALTALQLIDNTVFVDDAAFTVGTSSVNAIGMLADQASTDSVNEGDVGIPRMTLTRQAVVTCAPSVDTEGATISMNIDVDETEDAVKASAGKILGWFLYNDGATEVYVKFYNDTTANVVVGTTVPVLTIPVPAGSGSNVSWGDIGGIPFSAAITIAATTAATTADTGAPAANQVIANVLYI